MQPERLSGFPSLTQIRLAGTQLALLDLGPTEIRLQFPAFRVRILLAGARTLSVIRRPTRSAHKRSTLYRPARPPCPIRQEVAAAVRLVLHPSPFRIATAIRFCMIQLPVGWGKSSIPRVAGCNTYGGRIACQTL